MLIVNADDLGRHRGATDSALLCCAKKCVSSVSAMVFMEDSERAAELALDSGIGVGLHLNLSERFSADRVPPRLREAHERICRFLTANKYAPLVYHPWASNGFRYVFAAQHEEFLRLYGRAPSHIDGHQHMHLATNVLLQRILPPGSKVRRSFTFRPGEKSIANRWYRNVVDLALAQRHRMTDFFFSLSHNLLLERFERIVALAAQTNVELMVHPDVRAEYDFLVSEGYRKAVSRVQLASYETL